MALRKPEPVNRWLIITGSYCCIRHVAWDSTRAPPLGQEHGYAVKFRWTFLLLPTDELVVFINDGGCRARLFKIPHSVRSLGFRAVSIYSGTSFTTHYAPNVLRSGCKRQKLFFVLLGTTWYALDHDGQLMLPEVNRRHEVFEIQKSLWPLDFTRLSLIAKTC